MAALITINQEQITGPISITIHPPVLTTPHASTQGVLSNVNFKCIHCGQDNQVGVNNGTDVVNEDVAHRKDENNNVKIEMIDLSQEDDDLNDKIIHMEGSIETKQQPATVVEQNGQMINQEVNHHSPNDFADELVQYLLDEKENLFDEEMLFQMLNDPNMNNVQNARTTTEYFNQSQEGYWSPRSNHYNPFPYGYF